MAENESRETEEKETSSEEVEEFVEASEEIMEEEIDKDTEAIDELENPLEKELEETKAKLEEKENDYLRLQAELQNIQKRNRREHEKTVRYRSQDLAKKLLPALDNMERALAIEVEHEAGKNLKKGIEMVAESIKEALASEGITEIDAEGQAYDPNFHEAYGQVPAEEGQESGVVAQVYEKGYKLHDRVLRAAKVTVTQ